MMELFPSLPSAAIGPTRAISALACRFPSSWAVTIHKSQGLTLDKVVIDVGKREFSCGLTYVACSRLRHLTDL